MISVFEGSTDITQYLERNSLRVREALGNNRNTASFGMLQHKIQQGAAVRVFDAFELTQDASSGQDTLHVLDTFEECDKFRVGDRILAPLGAGVSRKYTILDIDHAAKTVQLTENLAATVTRDLPVGKIRFGGVMIKAPEAEIGVTGTFEYACDLVDWGNLFDRKIVVDTYEEQYPREIYGRISYGFCANDSELTLDSFESAWTEASVGLVMANEATDRLEGTYAQKTGTSGSGTATWTKTISAANITAYDHVRWWWKVGSGHGSKVTAMKIRIGTSSSHYREYTLANIGQAFEDCWNYESIEVANYSSVTGSPNMAAATWVQLVVTCNAAIATGNILFDHLWATTGGFTLQNVMRGDTKLDDLRVAYKKPTVVIDDIAKKLGLFQYIDYERDIHLIRRESELAPFQLTDTSENYGELVITPDMTKIVNRQTVRGGEAASDSLFTEEFVADGVQTTFVLAYKPDGLKVYVSNWNGSSYDAYVEKTVGIENIVLESSYDFVFSFNEKNVRNAAFAKLDITDKIKFTYYPYKPIRKRVINYVSVARMKALTGGDGFYDGAPIVDSAIKSFEDAQLRGQAEVSEDAYGNPLISATFRTQVDGLHAGMIIPIVDSSRGIDESYLIQSVMANVKDGDRFSYEVMAGSTLFGIVEFLQWLIKKNISSDTDTAELVDVVINQDETLELEDDYVFTHKSKSAKAGTRVNKTWDFIAESGTISASGIIGTGLLGSNFYAAFTGSEIGSAGFQASNHNNNKELFLTTTIGGSGKNLVVRNIYKFPLTPSTQYTLRAWLELRAALTNVGSGGGVKLYIKEYSSLYALTAGALQTDTLLTEITAMQDFKRYELVFTTHASTAFGSLYVEIDQAIGTARIADIKLLQTGVTEALAVPAIASFSQAS